MTTDGPEPSSALKRAGALPWVRHPRPVDLAVSAAIDRTTASWNSERREASIRLLGWSGDPLEKWTLAHAADSYGWSRETVRRARTQVAVALQTDPLVVSGVRDLAALLADLPRIASERDDCPDHPGELHLPLVAVAERVRVAGLIRAQERLGPLVRVLEEVGFNLPVQLVASHEPADEGRPRINVAWPDMDDPGLGPGFSHRLLAATSDGRPYLLRVLLEDLGQSSVIFAGSQKNLALGDAARSLLETGRWRAVNPLPRPSMGREATAAPTGLPEWVAVSGDLAAALPTPRALLRLLSISGPLPWVDLLAAWSRGQGRGSFPSLPSEVDVLRAWVDAFADLRIRDARILSSGVETTTQVIEAVDAGSVRQDKTTLALQELLHDRPEGMSRSEILERVPEFGLKPATIATALTYHPALTHAGRDLWILLRSPVREPAPDPLPATGLPTTTLKSARAMKARSGALPAPPPRLRRDRSQPVTYTWSPSGALVLRGQVPFSPSPVLYVPTAVRSLLEGRTLQVHVATAPNDPAPDQINHTGHADMPRSVSASVPGTGPPVHQNSANPRNRGATLRIKGSNLWGFASLLADAGLCPGDTLELHCDLVAGTATLIPNTSQGDTA